MRDPERIDRILGKLRKYWVRNPDMRLGQMIAVFAEDITIFYVEDSVIENGLDEDIMEHDGYGNGQDENC